MNRNQASTAKPLSGLRLWLARAAWLSIVVISLILFTMGTLEKYQAPFPSNCTVDSCNPIEYTAEDAANLEVMGFESDTVRPIFVTFNLLFNLGFIILAFVIYSQKSDDVMVLLLTATMIILGGVAFSPANDVLLRSRAELGPLINGIQGVGYTIISVLLLIFPDGRFVPRWTRMIILPVVLIIVPQIIYGTNHRLISPQVALAFFAFVIIVSVFAQRYRFRRVSNSVQRQQVKWGVLGLLGIFAVMIIWTVIATLFPVVNPSLERTYALTTAWFVLILIGVLVPSSFAIAVLRYRLWDIDIIIRRTLQYGLFTSILAVVFFVTVVLLQEIFRNITGESNSSLITVLSTLGIAALFNPLRIRVQEFIDRRFYRQKYDAEQTMAHFANSARDEVDLEALTVAILGVVDETMQPEHVSIWLRMP